MKYSTVGLNLEAWLIRSAYDRRTQEGMHLHEAGATGPANWCDKLGR